MTPTPLNPPTTQHPAITAYNEKRAAEREAKVRERQAGMTGEMYWGLAKMVGDWADFPREAS